MILRPSDDFALHNIFWLRLLLPRQPKLSQALVLNSFTRDDNLPIDANIHSIMTGYCSTCNTFYGYIVQNIVCLETVSTTIVHFHCT